MKWLSESVATPLNYFIIPTALNKRLSLGRIDNIDISNAI